jgi:dTDP-4-amino-4,6-dideoxygalactose transaminase
MLFDALCQEKRKTILLPAFICPSLTSMAAATDMKVVLVDVDRDTLHPHPGRLEHCLAEYRDSESVLVVDHAFGYPFAAIGDVRRQHPELLIIEDCVRALGSEIDGRAVGHTGDLTLLSLYKTVQGNNHGALLLARSPYSIRSGPAPATTWRQRSSTLRPLRRVYELIKRRHPDFCATPRILESRSWLPTIGVPNQLCLARFAKAIDRLGTSVARRREAAAEIKTALGDLEAIRIVQTDAGCDTDAYFLSFTVADGIDRNSLLTSLHRRGLFLLRTWDAVPAFFDCFSKAFPFGFSESVFLADHVAHIPVGWFLEAGLRKRLVTSLRELIGPAAARCESVGVELEATR